MFVSKSESKGQWSKENFVVAEQEGKVRFHDFNLPDGLMRAIQELGYEYCSPIQGKSIPVSLTGADILGKAQTGTGKTAAFLVSVITDLVENPLKEQFNGEPRSLILAPTRELALQIAEDAKRLCRHLDLKVTVAVGGMDFQTQQKQLQNDNVDILVATPGRLIDFMLKKSVFLDQIEILVIDEGDRMLDMGFIPDLKNIIRAAPYKNHRQTLMFSATWTSDITTLAKTWTNEPEVVEVEADNRTAETVEQHIYLVSADDKYKLLTDLLKNEDIERAMIFANRRDIVRNLFEQLRKEGMRVSMLSGEVSQDKRIKTLAGFKGDKYNVLVATDVAGRGIHIDGVSHVINFTLPEDAEDYVHRIGRTGRAGKDGKSISFACEDDSFQIPALEEYLGRKLELEPAPDFSAAVETK
jgi:ATP-dependent RNA helicase RhlB